MKFFNRLESKIGRFAIKNLMIYLVALYVIGFIIISTDPSIYYLYLCLNPERILHGEVWRIITYLCYPPSESILLCLLSCYFFFIMGRFLEKIQGTFRFNVYIFTGILGQVLASVLIYVFSGEIYLLTPSYIYTTMFLAIAVTFPEMQFYIYMVLPVKAKWLAVLYGVFIGYEIVVGSWPDRVAIIMSFLNFIIYYIFVRDPVRRAQQAKRRASFEKQAAPQPKSVARHRCAVCGITELDAPDMEFRYCTKCDGNLEYCMDHLYTHVHVKKEDTNNA